MTVIILPDEENGQTLRDLIRDVSAIQPGKVVTNGTGVVVSDRLAYGYIAARHDLPTLDTSAPSVAAEDEAAGAGSPPGGDSAPPAPAKKTTPAKKATPAKKSTPAKKTTAAAAQRSARSSRS